MVLQLQGVGKGRGGAWCVWHIENKTKKNERVIDSKSGKEREKGRGAKAERAGNRKPLAVAGNWHLKVCRMPHHPSPAHTHNEEKGE